RDYMENKSRAFGGASHKRRPGFTLLELTVAALIIAILFVIVAQSISISLRERARSASRQAATELAANILEGARAQPFDKLDKSWADAQVIPTETADLLPQGKIAITIEPEKSSPHAKRIKVEVQWRFEEHLAMQSVQLSMILAARE